MSATVSDYVWRRLAEWGVDRVYGYPGDGINGMLGALNRIAHDGDFMHFVQARHEEMAAFMACEATSASGGRSRPPRRRISQRGRWRRPCAGSMRSPSRART